MLEERLLDQMPKANCVEMKDEKAFICPTVFGHPDGLDFTSFGYSTDFSCKVYGKHTGNDDEEANDFSYQASTTSKDLPEPDQSLGEIERSMLDILLFGHFLVEIYVNVLFSCGRTIEDHCEIFSYYG